MNILYEIFPYAQSLFKFCFLPKNKKGVDAPLTTVPARMLRKLLYLELSRLVLGLYRVRLSIILLSFIRVSSKTLQLTK
jgi:hypothetical protein